MLLKALRADTKIQDTAGSGDRVCVGQHMHTSRGHIFIQETAVLPWQRVVSGVVWVFL